ncbi:MAG: sugar transferase [Clostridia bacterium]|nr:sugar transferase [Clostridia bacterium]
MKYIYVGIKWILDRLLSLIAGILFFPFFLLFALIIKCSSRGPILFKQKRIGKNKKPFMIWKFRTMKIDAPHDTPTHMLNDPDQYITKFGKFLRKTSMDELPQIYNILFGKMSIIGPRPALWNQYDLIAERDKYGVNKLYPGLTGWAQIHGRDELEIAEKAKLDGEYVKKFGFIIDVKCFFGTIKSVFKHEGVVEGGTGEIHKETEEKTDDKTNG